MMTACSGSLGIHPATRGGCHTPDRALDLKLLQDAVGYIEVPHGPLVGIVWHLVYEDGNVGRATIECTGFELTCLALDRYRYNDDGELVYYGR